MLDIDSKYIDTCVRIQFKEFAHWGLIKFPDSVLLQEFPAVFPQDRRRDSTKWKPNRLIKQTHKNQNYLKTG